MPRYGKTLEELMFKIKFKISRETIYVLGLRILSALEIIHNAGFVFNDLKPDNILLEYEP